MKIFDNTLFMEQHSFAVLESFCHVPKEQICFFDIETTGLSPKVSSVYLIGVLWYDSQDEQFHTRQWFADDYISEKNLIEHFTAFLSSFTTLVHYNGFGFDVPYIEKKCLEHCLPSPFETVRSLDIFKEIRRLKSLFDVPNLKLSTAEKLTGFLRQDLLSGRDCIEAYSQFMQKKYFKDAGKNKELGKLLLHNREDLLGTWHCARLLSFRCSGSFQSITENESSLIAMFSVDTPFPFPLKQHFEAGFSLWYEDCHIGLEIPLYKGELCHFFSNYKDYFYLPAEDTAIHKSVGAYVEKEHRQQAKASNCYTKKEGCFLPIPAGISEENRLLFRHEYKSKQHYIPWNEKQKQDSLLFEEILQVLITSV